MELVRYIVVLRQRDSAAIDKATAGLVFSRTCRYLRNAAQNLCYDTVHCKGEVALAELIRRAESDGGLSFIRCVAWEPILLEAFLMQNIRVLYIDGPTEHWRRLAPLPFPRLEELYLYGRFSHRKINSCLAECTQLKKLVLLTCEQTGDGLDLPFATLRSLHLRCYQNRSHTRPPLLPFAVPLVSLSIVTLDIEGSTPFDLPPWKLLCELFRLVLPPSLRHLRLREMPICKEPTNHAAMFRLLRPGPLELVQRHWEQLDEVAVSFSIVSDAVIDEDSPSLGYLLSDILSLVEEGQLGPILQPRLHRSWEGPGPMEALGVEPIRCRAFAYKSRRREGSRVLLGFGVRVEYVRDATLQTHDQLLPLILRTISARSSLEELNIQLFYPVCVGHSPDLLDTTEREPLGPTLRCMVVGSLSVAVIVLSSYASSLFLFFRMLPKTTWRCFHDCIAWCGVGLLGSLAL